MNIFSSALALGGIIFTVLIQIHEVRENQTRTEKNIRLAAYTALLQEPKAHLSAMTGGQKHRVITKGSAKK